MYYAAMEASMEIAKDRGEIIKECIDTTETLGQLQDVLEQKGIHTIP